MKYLSKTEILKIHDLLIEKFGGEEAIKDITALDSVITQPVSTYGSTELYPTIVQKACRLCYGIVKSQPFIDGNSTTGAVVLLTILRLNKIELGYTQTELIEIISGIKNSEIDFKQLVDWVDSLVI